MLSTIKFHCILQDFSLSNSLLRQIKGRLGTLESSESVHTIFYQISIAGSFNALMHLGAILVVTGHMYKLKNIYIYNT